MVDVQRAAQRHRLISVIDETYPKLLEIPLWANTRSSKLKSGAHGRTSREEDNMCGLVSSNTTLQHPQGASRKVDDGTEVDGKFSVRDPCTKARRIRESDFTISRTNEMSV